MAGTHQDPTDHGDFESSWRDTEKDSLNEKADTLGATVDSSRKAACLSRQMELQVQAKQMFERLPSDLANGTLTYVGEHGVQQFAGERSTDTCHPV